MKIIKAEVDNCGTFSFQCKKIRVVLTHCPFLESHVKADICSIENKKVDDIFKLPEWCPLENYMETIKYKHIDHFDLEDIRTAILHNYPTVDTSREIIDKDILNPFLGMDIKEILKYKPNREQLGYDIWYV